VGSEKKRSYLNPEFELGILGKSMDELKDSASWNWDLAKRRVRKIYNQHQADKAWEKKHPKEPGLGLGNTAKLLERVDD
jgi:hypothetical protein